ncbi:MAG: type II toxin-antitoxin system RelE/ParE family toxin [Succinivibrio sp.]|nr:type II toxin-antitoxin system RelE/ParE family toxin [Succinivibrio sp.]
MNNSYVLLHLFIKKTQKTPRREIEKALREFEDLKKFRRGDK